MDVSESLRNEMRAAVLGPGRLVVAGVEGTLLAVRDRREAGGRDSVAHEEILRGLRPALAERQVVLHRSPLVAMPLDDGLGHSVALEEPRVVLERRLRVR